jgi:hypothetical protein
VHGLARLIVVAAVVAACKDAPPPFQRPGVDGLVAFLAPAGSAGWLGDCVPTPTERAAVTTPGYRDLGFMRVDARAMQAAWDRRGRGRAQARVLYADDAEVPAFLRRARPAVPVGAPPLVATIDGDWVPALWVFRERWLCLVGIDRQIAVALRQPCRAAYLRTSVGRCLDFTAPLASAVMRGDTVARERLCTLMVEHGCGSVPAEAPPPTEHLQPQ